MQFHSCISVPCEISYILIVRFQLTRSSMVHDKKPFKVSEGFPKAVCNAVWPVLMSANLVLLFKFSWISLTKSQNNIEINQFFQNIYLENMIAEIKNTGKILSLMFKSSHMTEAYNKICLITLAIELSLKSRFWIVSSTNRFSAQSCLAKSQ